MRLTAVAAGLAGVLSTLPVAVPPAHAQPAPPPAASAAPPAAAPAPIGIEEKAAGILRQASATLAAARTMSFDAVNTYERAARNGQPLYYTTLNHVALQRPDHLRVVTPGDGTPDEIYYDGKTLTAYVPSADLAATTDAPPTIDEMVDAAWQKAAIYFPFSDVIVSDPYDQMMKTMKSAFYVGQSSVVGGVVTDMVAVASDDVQAEIWIGTADHLPRLVRVAYPNEPAHATYQSSFSNWRLNAQLPAGTFTSDKAAHARKMPFAPPASGAAKP